ncbi:MAG: chemotaxis protein CheW [Prochloraceae cyanobacterium]
MIQEYFGIELSQTVNLAVPLTDVKMVTRLEPEMICSIPGVAPYWLGVINQQGSLLWVLDGERFFALDGAGERQEQKLTALILTCSLEETQRRIALVIKALEGVVNLDNTDAGLPLPRVMSPQFGYLFTTTHRGDGQSVWLLDVEAFFQLLDSQSQELVTFN